jgi:hypothetical protein
VRAHVTAERCSLLDRRVCDLVHAFAIYMLTSQRLVCRPGV